MRERVKKFLTRDKATTFADVLGAGLVAVGMGLVAGVGAALVTAGVLILVGSYLVA